MLTLAASNDFRMMTSRCMRAPQHTTANLLLHPLAGKTMQVVVAWA